MLRKGCNFVSIRISSVVCFVGVTAISNKFQSRLEMQVRLTSALLRDSGQAPILHGAATTLADGNPDGKWEICKGYSTYLDVTELWGKSRDGKAEKPHL